MRRIRQASRWLAGGAVVLSGAFAGLAAAATHASQDQRSTSATPVTQQQQQQLSVQPQYGDDGGFEDGQAQLQPPAQVPQQAPSASVPQSSSGAS